MSLPPRCFFIPTHTSMPPVTNHPSIVGTKTQTSISAIPWLKPSSERRTFVPGFEAISGFAGSIKL